MCGATTAARGRFLDAFVTGGSGGLANPRDLTFGPDGNLYVASGLSDQVLRYNGSTGAFLDAFVTGGSGGLDSPSFLIFTPEPAAVPEPSSVTLLGLGAFGLRAYLWRRHVRPRDTSQA